MRALRGSLLPLILVAGCGSSSNESCPADLAAGVPTTVTIVGEDGTAICDAYVTRGEPPFATFCEWSGCACVAAASFYGPDPSRPLALSLIVSRRGFATTPIAATLPPPPKDRCGEAISGFGLTVTMKQAATGAACVPRDAVACPDHRTCYAGALPAGCMMTSETSSDPGASYVCCQ